MPSLAGVNGLDLAVAALLLVSAGFAYFRGFVHEVLSITGWIGAAAAAIYGFPHAKPYFRQFIDNALFADIAAGAALFLVALVVLSLLARMISRRVKDSALGALDRALGFLFGLARGALIAVLAFVVYMLAVPPKERPEWVAKARTTPWMGAGANLLIGALPPSTADRLGLRRPKTGDGAAPEPTIRDLLQPRPKAPDRDPPEGYTEKERQDMQRLIDSTGKRQ
ncbi:MAG: CvpA family protein [Rhodospirillales bacterium]|nr:CvpA family protein [Rhodospirillales bacterium]